MAKWFEGEVEIKCDIQRVKDALENIGELYVGVVNHMPGLTTVELVEQGNDSMVITTNEGLMKRTNLTKLVEADRVVVEFDEEYEAGTKFTATSHFSEEFVTSGTGVTHRLAITDVTAPGFLGFLYRRFGSSRIGNALLNAYKAHLEQ